MYTYTHSRRSESSKSSQENSDILFACLQHNLICRFIQNICRVAACCMKAETNEEMNSFQIL